jgi:hypothetical protein
MSNIYLDPEECPTVAKAMGIPGMLSGYPLYEAIEYQPEMETYPEEPEFFYDEEE